jgi:hypothetical protein
MPFYFNWELVLRLFLVLGLGALYLVLDAWFCFLADEGKKE